MEGKKSGKDSFKKFWLRAPKKNPLKMHHKSTGNIGEFVKEFSVNGTPTTAILSEDNLLQFAPSEEFETVES